MQNNIRVAKTAGFCFGVKRAVDIVYDLIDRGGSVCTLGPIIHNMEMVSELEAKGCKAVDRVEDCPEGSTIVIRSHGVAQNVYDKISELGLECVDATCPFVKKIHKIVKKAGESKTPVLIAGNKNHPEIQGIIGHCEGECYTFNNDDELNELIKIIPIKNNDEVYVVAQTTFSKKEWKKCLKTVKKVYTNAKIFDTICKATSERQEEAEEISSSSDLMIVIGDRHSSNTAKLYDICKAKCRNTVLIETASELDKGLVSISRSIGVTAGASTPARIIKEVLDTMSEEVKSSETVENESFEEMLEESLKNLNTNERVKGVVVSIAPNEVIVDVGRKQSGYIPADELSNDPSVKPEDVVKVGDEIELLIMKTNDAEGTIMLSKRRVDAQKSWDELKELAESNTVLTGKVASVVKGGVILIYKDNRVFIPASQATDSRDENLEDLVGKEVQFKLLEASQRGRMRRIVGSIRALLREKRAAQRAEFWETCEVGKHYTGTVKSLTSYGAFVDLGGVFGMIHISELSWTHIKNPAEVVSVGDKVDVYVKDINEETKKISLGYKDPDANPWEILRRDFPVDTVVDATIVGLTTFGAFANVIPGIDGLIHISQIANKRIEKPEDVLKIGETVKAKIIAIDFDKKRVSLSIRALLPVEETPAEDEKAEAEEEVVASTEDEVVASTETPVEEASAVEEKAEEPAPAAEEAPAEKAEEAKEEAPAEKAEEAEEKE
ncbi:MAG: bifunctional 4-hydroxy-3-methylbut-2-enyl diphosphate reductase/30S ribosomal protein S1 [Ruminococcus sp.]|nr:bifunctional 4-hydroxy-3-methylbut-2-enyl diphosphate reductase/30S ribosomal protein S1 [Ruminococcus sp.]